MIKLMEKSQTYEVMDLWLRTTMRSNSFVEPDFWEKHYDFVKEKYINESDTFVYIEDGKIAGFTGVSPDNMIMGLFVDPNFQNRGIGTAIINYLKSKYSLLHIEIYARSRKALAFSTKLGFVIDGAIRHPHNNEIMYTMLWSE
ncbi:MAG: GNAT family N-acetyltransferase [Oscillospiraceae bacterium]|nr:GNAT family N-acetyltransferase [Oscillospiraceae bacterium]